MRFTETGASSRTVFDVDRAGPPLKAGAWLTALTLIRPYFD